jgi:hypothetical protein
VGRKGRGKRGGRFVGFVGSCKTRVGFWDKLWVLDLCIKIRSALYLLGRSMGYVWCVMSA